MMNPLSSRWRLWVLGALLVGAPLRQTHDTGPLAILGWWHGTSTCVPAAWNAACNNERILYEFVPAPPDSNHSLLHASKIVQGQVEPMGDLEFTYSPSRTAWDADFANSRVSIRWSFETHGDSLIGQLFLRPEMRVARHVVAWKGKGAT